MIARLSSFAFKARYRYHHFRRAFAYATNRLSCDNAQHVILDCRDAAGWYPVMTLTPSDVLDMAISRHGDPAHSLKPYLPSACEYAARKWESGDDYYNALGFALDTALEFAAQDGIDLDKTKDDPTPTPEGEQGHA